MAMNKQMSILAKQATANLRVINKMREKMVQLNQEKEELDPGTVDLRIEAEIKVVKDRIRLTIFRADIDDIQKTEDVK